MLPVSGLGSIFAGMCRNKTFGELSVYHLQALFWQSDTAFLSSKNISNGISGCWQIWWNEVESMTRGGSSCFSHKVLEKKTMIKR